MITPNQRYRMSKIGRFIIQIVCHVRFPFHTYEIFLGRGVSETNITFWGSFKWPLPFERHYTRSGEEVISSDDDNDKHDDNDKDNDNGDSSGEYNGCDNDKNHENDKRGEFDQ